jgi:hypothetical protein
MKPLSVQHSVGDACTPQKAMARKDGANCACARAAPNGGGRHSAQRTVEGGTARNRHCFAARWRLRMAISSSRSHTVSSWQAGPGHEGPIGFGTRAARCGSWSVLTRTLHATEDSTVSLS